jgi:hypothetical protein
VKDGTGVAVDCERWRWQVAGSACRQPGGAWAPVTLKGRQTRAQRHSHGGGIQPHRRFPPRSGGRRLGPRLGGDGRS